MTTMARTTRSINTNARQPDRLRVGFAALVVGLVSEIPLGLLHPHREYPNDSVAAFQEYAHSQGWVLVHLGQFLGMLVATFGLVVIGRTLARQSGVAGFLGVAAEIASIVSASVFAVQMAVDGVALKAAIDAWQAASGVGHMPSFQIADSVRSVEKGLSALFNLTNGLALLTLGLSITKSDYRGRRLGWLGATAGAGLFTVGVLTAQTGFSHEATSVALPTTVFLIAFSCTMAVASWRNRTD